MHLSLKYLIFCLSLLFSVVHLTAGNEVSVASLAELPPIKKGATCSDFVSDESGNTFLCMEKTVTPGINKYLSEYTVTTWQLKNGKWSAIGKTLEKIYAASYCRVDTQIYMIVQTLFFKRKIGDPGADSTRIYSLENNTWKPVGQKIKGHINGIVSFQNLLYAYGDFDRTDTDIEPCTFMILNKTVWQPKYAKGANKTRNYFEAKDVAVFNNKLVFVGSISIITTNGETHGIAMWDGTNWSSTGFTATMGFNSVCTYQDKLFVSGSFTTTGKKQEKINNILCWDEKNGINAMLGGTNGPVENMFVMNELLILIGGYGSAGGITKSAGPIAWNGSDYQNVFNSISLTKNISYRYYSTNWVAVGNKWLVPTDIEKINGIETPGLSLINFR